MASKTGLLIVGHGARSPLGQAEFAEVFEQIASHYRDAPAALAFLEHARPMIGEAVEALYRQGVASILTVPLLLFAAGHAKSDIPQQVQEAAQRRGIAILGQSDVLGIHPALVRLSLQKFAEKSPPYEAEAAVAETAFVLVGRGNHDPNAQRDAAEYLTACRTAGALSYAHLAFLAMAQPDLGDVLHKIAKSSASRCVVVPHLLFHGDLIEKCQTIVDRFAAQYPAVDWKLAERLGPAKEVVIAACDRIDAAFGRFSPIAPRATK